MCLLGLQGGRKRDEQVNKETDERYIKGKGINRQKMSKEIRKIEIKGNERMKTER